MAKQVFCCALLLISILTFAATAHALEVVNQLSVKITVYAPPLCLPCNCWPKPCGCTTQCRPVPGIVIATVSSAIVAPKETYPLAFLIVEVQGKVYSVTAADLARITVKATLVVTGVECLKEGIEAKLYLNPKFDKVEPICLIMGSGSRVIGGL